LNDSRGVFGDDLDQFQVLEETAQGSQLSIFGLGAASLIAQIRLIFDHIAGSGFGDRLFGVVHKVPNIASVGFFGVGTAAPAAIEPAGEKGAQIVQVVYLLHISFTHNFRLGILSADSGNGKTSFRDREINSERFPAGNSHVYERRNLTGVSATSEMYLSGGQNPLAK
jgi:hypothetical protein